MKLLILGDPYNLFVLNFAEALHKIDKEITIDILSNCVVLPKKINFEGKLLPYHKIYNNERLPKLITKIPLVRTYYRKAKASKALQIINSPQNKYDVILIHGIWIFNSDIFQKIKTQNVFVIGVIWGSDFYRRIKHKIYKILEKCQVINVSNPEMMQEVIKEFDIPESKFRNCKFGLAPLSYVYEILDLSTEEAKINLNFKPEEFLITCGYNGSNNHQHLKIIDTLKSIKDALPPHTRLVLPMTYGAKAAYKEEVLKALNECGIPYKVFDKFLTDKEVAYLRRATDVMLQLQINDAFSGSMQEHLLAQNIVVTGAWLPYQAHKEDGIFYETIENMGELKDILLYIFKNIDKFRSEISKNNHPQKFKKSLWSESIKDWRNMLYEYK